MTKVTAFVFAIFMVLASMNIAEARHSDGLEGLLIGGVSGAAIGHVITGTPEGVIVGSFLGGTIGMLVDAGNHRNHVVIIKDRHRHYRQWPGYYGRGYWPRGGDRHFHGKRWYKERRDHRWGHDRDRYRGRHHR